MSRHRLDRLPEWARVEMTKLRAESAKLRAEAAKRRVEAKEARAKLRSHEALDVIAKAVAQNGMDPTLTLAVLTTDRSLADLEADEPDFPDQVNRRLGALLRDESQLSASSPASSPRRRRTR